MSAHEHERLSGYLDDELPRAERAAVERHLATCTECRGFLAALAEVDPRAAGIPAAPAPDGYFDSFAGRVRGRIEAQARAPRRVLRVPAWGWAVAAALLLAVATPLTLRESPAARTLEPAAAAPPSRPGRDGGAGARTSAPAQAAPSPTRESGASRAAAEPPREKRALPSGSIAPRQSAVPLREAKGIEGAAGGGFAAAPAAPAGAALGVLPAADRAPAPAIQPAGLAKAAAKLDATDAALLPPPEAAAPQALAGEAANRAPAVAARADSVTSGSDLDYRRLEAARAIRLEDWRALRERWRAFASAHPGSPHADEARVQVVACGLEALRASRDDADLAAMERDAAAYFARSDAQQKPRVRALLEAAASR